MEQYDNESGLIEYYADLPSLNVYTAENGGAYYAFKKPESFMNYLLREGAITAEQRQHYFRGGAIKVDYDDLSVALYKMMYSLAYPGTGKDQFVAKDDVLALSHSRMYREFGLNKNMLGRLLYYFDESMLDFGNENTGSFNSFDAASVLARFSTTDPAQGERRADAVGEIIELCRSGNVDNNRVLDLLQTLVPELSLEERRRAVDKLARISADGEWGDTETAEGVFYLASLITGDEPNPEERIEAAHEMGRAVRGGRPGRRDLARPDGHDRT